LKRDKGEEIQTNPQTLEGWGKNKRKQLKNRRKKQSDFSLRRSEVPVGKGDLERKREKKRKIREKEEDSTRLRSIGRIKDPVSNKQMTKRFGCRMGGR